jgi:hypothetical protein
MLRAMGEPGFVVAAGDDFVFIDGDLVVIQEGALQPGDRFTGRRPPQHTIPVAKATAQLVGRTLRIHENGAPWVEVDDVGDLAVARDFCDELRRLRWAALQPLPEPAAPPGRGPAARPGPRPAPPAPIGPTVGQHVAGLIGDLVARLRAEIAQAPRRR